MAQDLNASDADSKAICELALETCAMAAETKFQNIDLITRAAAYFLEVIEMDASNFKAHLGLGILLLGGNMYEEAINFLQNAYDMRPSPEVESYLEFAEQQQINYKLSKVSNVLSSKKTTVNDLIDLSDKFKTK